MAAIDFPIALSRLIAPGGFSWGLHRNDLLNESVFGSQGVEIAGPRRICDLSPIALRGRDADAYQALVVSLKGRVNQLRLWNIMRPQPVGTMRGSMTLASAAAQGDLALVITAGAGQAGTTLLAGDYVGLGSGITQHLVMVMADATADGTGQITATIDVPLRDDFAGGTAVVWDYPCALFRQSATDAKWTYGGRSVRGFGLSLIEDWRP